MSHHMSLCDLIRRSTALPMVLLALPLLLQGQSGLSLADSSFRSLAEAGTDLVALSADGGLHRSTDNGASFTQQASAPTVVGDAGADFYGLGALGTSAVAVGVDGLIVRSTDSGQSWTQATAPISFGQLNAVAAREDPGNPNHWLAVGSDGFDGVVYQSSDDGANWTAVPTPPTAAALRAVLWTGQRWLAAGSDNFGFDGKVYHSTDGSTWIASTLPIGTLPLLDLATDGSTILAVGEGGGVLRSDDDGLNFTSILPGFAGGVDLNAAAVNSTGDFVIGGDQSLLFSYDGSTAATQVPATSGAAPVQAIANSGGNTVVSGPTTATGPRSEPFTLQLTPGQSGQLSFTLRGTYPGKSYYLETTTDLSADDWTLLIGSQMLGSSTPPTFQTQRQGEQLFYRAVEF